MKRTPRLQAMRERRLLELVPLLDSIQMVAVEANPTTETIAEGFYAMSGYHLPEVTVIDPPEGFAWPDYEEAFRLAAGYLGKKYWSPKERKASRRREYRRQGVAVSAEVAELIEQRDRVARMRRAQRGLRRPRRDQAVIRATRAAYSRTSPSKK
jgi:hypothetical protein